MPGGKAGPLLLSVVRRACALASLPSTGFSAAISPCSALPSSSFASMPLAALSAASLSAATGGLPSEAAAAPPLDVAGRAGRFLGGRPAYSSRVATMLLHSRGRFGGNAEVGWECHEARREQARHKIPRNRKKGILDAHQQWYGQTTWLALRTPNTGHHRCLLPVAMHSAAPTASGLASASPGRYSTCAPGSSGPHGGPCPCKGKEGHSNGGGGAQGKQRDSLGH